MGEPRGVTNEHHTSTDKAAAIKWRIQELEEDILVLNLYSQEGCEKARKGYQIMIDLCRQSIIKLEDDCKHIRH
jgi:hypothetical protein